MIKQFFENGGKEIRVLSTGVRFSRGASPFIKGLSLVSSTPSLNMLLIPATTLLPDWEATKVFQAAVPIIEKHRAVYLLDPPQQDALRQTVRDLVAWFRAQSGIRHPKLILYHPRVRVRSHVAPPPTLTIPASGTMAGLFARFDGIRGVWKAPAGTEATLQGVVKLDKLLTSQNIDLLASANIMLSKGSLLQPLWRGEHELFHLIRNGNLCQFAGQPCF